MTPKTFSPPPPSGAMYLFDRLTPPLRDGSYSIKSSTAVTLHNQPGKDTVHANEDHALENQRYFDVVGPRFTLPPTDVSDVYPPRNAHGAFHDALAQIVLGREMLPWERELAKPADIKMPAHHAGDPPQIDPAQLPWVALLLFEDGEYTLHRNVALDQVVPPDVFKTLGSPGGIVCDAVEARRSLITAIVPSYEEVALLAHVRWVNVDDRELNAAGGDGFYAVVMTNRLALPGTKCRACLVSLEARTDLIADAQTQEAPDIIIRQGAESVGTVVRSPAEFALTAAAVSSERNARAFEVSAEPVRGVTIFGGDVVSGYESSIGVGGISIELIDPKERLVVLHTWEFTCESGGTFKELMTGIDSAIFGTVAEPGKPALVDTGHLRVSVNDRVGVPEAALYRGPLVAYELTRDALGPYHSADQARRATPEAGLEDISYAAAFELGRLLAAADARLAQELMRWRRGAYRQSGRADVIFRLADAYKSLSLPAASLTERLHAPLPAQIAAGAVRRVARANPPIGDAYGLVAAAGAIGLQAAALQKAWNLPSEAHARGLLDGVGAVLGSSAPAPHSNANAGSVTLAEVARDVAGLAHLAAARDTAIGSAVVKGQH